MNSMYAMAFLSAGLLAVLLTPGAARLARHVGAIDQPGGRRINTRPTPRMGGLAMVAATSVLGFLLAPGNPAVRAILLSGGIMALVGMADDIWGLPPRVKLLGQIVAGLTLAFLGIRIEFVTNPWGGMWYTGLWAVPLTVLWVVALANVINLIDGLDGLAAGVVAIAAAAMFVVAQGRGLHEEALLALLLAGAAGGFLRYNFHPARVFMGDTGSLYLGFMLGAISAAGAVKGATAVALTIPTLALGVPVLDTAMAIVRRTMHGQSFFQADRGHLHHRLLALGLSQVQAVIVVYGLTAILSLLAIVLAGMSSIYSFLALGLLLVVGTVAAVRVGILNVPSVPGRAPAPPATHRHSAR
ncbi:MAG: undecaprenyl/decaprenyl-phosphate alpha-N-acetylglucosaminyl 1-phosphate transferase [Firmicutes bacterium]|nr:undecaprenyl/decaprenyl-phosphate alpha-N-acetylglucosaminyl 1-phosphate transferase [Bacillota bacterium]